MAEYEMDIIENEINDALASLRYAIEMIDENGIGVDDERYPYVRDIRKALVAAQDALRGVEHDVDWVEHYEWGQEQESNS